MTLAALDINLIIFAIAGIVALVNWLTKKDEDAPTTKAPPKNPPVARGGADPDDERMRRFLEALGVPADQRPPPPVKPRPAPAESGPLPKIAPRPPFVAGPEFPPRRTQRAPAPVRPKASEHSPKAAPEPAVKWEERALDAEETTTLPVEQIHLPNLPTAPLPEFVTTSSRISATPNDAAAVGETDAYKTRGEDEARPSSAIRGLLSSPADLRAAILLREILGPPPGLKTGAALPSYFS